MTAHSWEKLYLDDLSLGQEFESDPVRVHREAMLAFAREYDPQPFHLSAEEAGLSLFGGLAASGWNTAALTMKMLVASVPLADGIIGLGSGEGEQAETEHQAEQALQHGARLRS